MAEQKITDEQVEKIIEYLEGSCQPFEKGIQTITENDDLTQDDLTDEQQAHIDQTIFLCSDCGWWFEMSEETKSANDDEMGCRDCNPDDEDEDEDY